jgi:hypothetical protein
VSWSSTLFAGSGPVGLPPVPWIEKNNWKFVIFRPTEVIAAAVTWLDGQPSNFFFLSGLQKLEQQVKKYIELRGEYVE